MTKEEYDEISEIDVELCHLQNKRNEINNQISLYEEDDTFDLEQELADIEEAIYNAGRQLNALYEIEHTYDAPTENLCKSFEPNPNQDRIKRLQIIKKELESVQEWHKENDKQKNEHVKFKISVCLSLIEFLKYGKCDTHKALLPNALIFNNNPYPAVNMGIEDIHSREVVSFVRNLAEVAFEDYYGYIVWSTHPSRRVNREKLYTNAVKLAVVDVTTNVDLMTFDLKNYYGKRLDIDLSSIQMENVDKLNVHIIAYSRGGDIVIKHENLELTKENNIQIDIPDIMKDL